MALSAWFCVDADTPGRQTGQEGGDFLLAQLPRMAFSMKHNEPSNPSDIRLLGSPAVVPDANDVANPIEKLGGLRILHGSIEPLLEEFSDYPRWPGG